MLQQVKLVIPSRSLVWMVIGSAIILLLASTTRHGLLQSHAWDLGIFDQPLYLLSQGSPPISTIVNIHILGDHAAWIFYPLSLLYRVYPDVHWLFLVQAIALAGAAIPIWFLAQQAGLKESQATAIAAVYLLYPLVFNLNLFDFHPETIALPLFFASVLAARSRRLAWFVICVIVILGCRDALSLTVAAMGVWLWGFEQRRVYGAIAFIAGIVWFILATQVILPHFQPAGVLGTSHFAEFGKTIPEILLNLLLRPDLLLRKLVTLPNVGYVLLLLSPLAWGLSVRHLAPLVAAIPQFAINLLSTSPALKDLVHQYSLPILPFLILVIIATVADGESWIQRPRRIVLWSLVAFMVLAQWSLFGTRFLSTLDTWQASRAAIAQITTKGSVLAPAALVPHLTHREVIKVVAGEDIRLDDYDYLLFNRRHPGRMSTPETVTQLIDRAHQNSNFRLRYEQDEVYLFSRANLTAVTDKGDNSPL